MCGGPSPPLFSEGRKKQTPIEKWLNLKRKGAERLNDNDKDVFKYLIRWQKKQNREFHQERCSVLKPTKQKNIASHTSPQRHKSDHTAQPIHRVGKNENQTTSKSKNQEKLSGSNKSLHLPRASSSCFWNRKKGGEGGEGRM